MQDEGVSWPLKTELQKMSSSSRGDRVKSCIDEEKHYSFKYRLSSPRPCIFV